LSFWYRGGLGQTSTDLSGEQWPPPMVGHGDGISGLAFAGGISAALLHRERTGEATVVDSSLMGTAVWFNGPALVAAQKRPAQRKLGPVKRKLVPGTPESFIRATLQIYQTQDYRFINLLFLGDDDRDFVDFCERVGRAELGTDPRFAHAKERATNALALIAIFDEMFASKPFEEWKELLKHARGAWAPVQTPEEVHVDPQTTANGFISQVDYPDGPLRIPSPPILFDGEAGQAPRAPDFAEHTDAILAELGCSAEDIARYRGAGTVV
jgi:crotonobetainyl-CoA:carnitine CoA-transferase CaiB-like acyl-CoA transferase